VQKYSFFWKNATVLSLKFKNLNSILNLR